MFKYNQQHHFELDCVHLMTLLIFKQVQQIQKFIACRKAALPYSRFCLWDPISAKHQLLWPVVISAIIISVKQSPITKLFYLVKSSHDMAKLNPKYHSVIRGYHVYKDVWVSYIGEVLQCCHDAYVHSHHDPLAFWVRQPSRNVHSFKVFEQRPRIKTSRTRKLWHVQWAETKVQE